MFHLTSDQLMGISQLRMWFVLFLALCKLSSALLIALHPYLPQLALPIAALFAHFYCIGDCYWPFQRLSQGGLDLANRAFQAKMRNAHANVHVRGHAAAAAPTTQEYLTYYHYISDFHWLWPFYALPCLLAYLPLWQKQTRGMGWALQLHPEPIHWPLSRTQYDTIGNTSDKDSSRRRATASIYRFLCAAYVAAGAYAVVTGLYDPIWSMMKMCGGAGGAGAAIAARWKCFTSDAGGFVASATGIIAVAELMPRRPTLLSSVGHNSLSVYLLNSIVLTAVGYENTVEAIAGLATTIAASAQPHLHILPSLLVCLQLAAMQVFLALVRPPPWLWDYAVTYTWEAVICDNSTRRLQKRRLLFFSTLFMIIMFSISQNAAAVRQAMQVGGQAQGSAQVQGFSRGALPAGIPPPLPPPPRVTNAACKDTEAPLCKLHKLACFQSAHKLHEQQRRLCPWTCGLC